MVLNHAIEYNLVISTKNPAYRRFNVEVSWIKPPDNWVKLNSNGASLRNSGKAGGGCVIKDHRGAWVKGCARSIGQASSCAAELWALRDGLNLCISMFCPNVITLLPDIYCLWLMTAGYFSIGLPITKSSIATGKQTVWLM